MTFVAPNSGPGTIDPYVCDHMVSVYTAKHTQNCNSLCHPELPKSLSDDDDGVEDTKAMSLL